MSALGGQLNFGIRLSATDDTQGAIASAKSALGAFKNFVIRPISIPLQIGRGGLGILRDLNLGLRPAVAAIDDIVEKGTGLEVVRKSFEALTGKSSGDARGMAHSLVEAANGTIRLAEAMRIANRGLASGLSFEQLQVALDFVSKKAITTGKSAADSLNTVITGLARGSTLFLDDFGILIDGIDGVRDAFDKIKGSGAFDALGPAAQKAEILRAAISEMRDQTKKIGVDGTELAFTWQRIKNSVGNAMDNMVAGIARSKALKSALEDVRGIFDGIGRHFEQGGSFKELIFGKGESGGLLGILGAGLKDIGTNLAAGFAGNFLHAMASGIEGFSSFFDEIKDVFSFESLTDLPDLIGKQFVKFTEAAAPLVEALKNVSLELKTAIVEGLAEFFASNRFTKWLFTTVGPDGTVKKGPLEKAAIVGEAIDKAGVGGTLDAAGKGAGTAVSGFWQGFINSFKWIGGEIRKEFRSSKNDQASTSALGAAGSPTTALAHAIGAVALAAVNTKTPLETFVESLRAAGDKALAGAEGFKHLNAALDKFIQAYGGNKKAPAPPLIDKDSLLLTGQRRQEMRREISKRKWRMRQRRMGRLGVDQRARNRARAEIERLRGEGKRITPRERTRIFKKAREDEIARKNDEDQKRIEGLEGELKKDDELRRKKLFEAREKRGYYDNARHLGGAAGFLSNFGAGGQIAAAIATIASAADIMAKASSESAELRVAVSGLTRQIAAGVKALSGAESEMARDAGKK